MMDIWNKITQVSYIIIYIINDIKSYFKKNIFYILFLLL